LKARRSLTSLMPSRLAISDKRSLESLPSLLNHGIDATPDSSADAGYDSGEVRN
jgi:hypothetical protein